MISRRHLLALATAFGSARAADPLKVGFIYVGPANDGGWNERHEQARLAVQAHFGDRIVTTRVESVPEGPAATQVIEQLIDRGHRMIVATSFGYMNPCVEAARRHPQVVFEHCAGTKRTANLATYNVRYYEGRYVQGVIAGSLLKLGGEAGFVAPLDVPSVITEMNGFLYGMRAVNPQARLKFVLTNSWYDPGLEHDAAKALIDQGCAVITQDTDGASALQLAESRGVYGFGESTDMIAFAPHRQLTSDMDNWAAYYIPRVQALLDGTWKSTNFWGGFASGVLQMAPYRNMPGDVLARAQKAEAAIREGRIQVFAGPLRDQHGVVQVAAGTVAGDDQLSAMRWLAEGIEGSMPG